jgi:SAM-dependent methyltransferase
MSRDDYILRPLDLQEIDRLRNQHLAWKNETDRVLDLGCGPGFLTVDLATRVGASGRVLGVDTSARFVHHLLEKAREQGFENVEATVADARDFPSGVGTFDGAISRWVLMFLSEPERVIRRLREALRPGDVFAAMEYAHFHTISLWPESEHFRRLYDAVSELIRGNGGDPNIGSRLPSMLVDHGFEILDLLSFWRVGRPGSELWRWLEETHENHRNLVEAHLISQDDFESYLRDWNERSAHPAAYMTAPPLLATIARKRS